MKPKNFVLITLLVVIVALGIWWFTQPTASSTQKTAQVPSPAKTNTPNIVAQVNQVEPPKLPPATPKAEAADSASEDAVPTPADPRTKIDTAIAEEIRLWQKNDIAGYWEEFMLPSTLKKIEANGKTLEQVAQGYQQSVDQAPHSIADKALVLGIFQATQGQTPNISEDGNTAVFNIVANGGKWRVIMEKENGLWYPSEDSGGMIFDGPAN
jgi:hypothetical protein